MGYVLLFITIVRGIFICMMTLFKRANKIRRTTIIICGLAACLGGIGLARVVEFPGMLWLGVGGVLLLALCRKQRVGLIIAAVFFGLLIGLWRGDELKTQLDSYKSLYNKKIIISGQATTDAVYGDKSQLSFDLGNLQLVEPSEQSLVGKLSIKGFGTSMVYRGDTVQVEGKLYQTRGSKQGSMSFADLAVVDQSDSKIESTRRQFQAGMQSALPEPQSSLALGLLIGQRNTLPSKVTEQLRMVGLTHIVAVSGFNLTIIIYAIRKCMIGRSKYQTLLLSVGLVSLFLLFTGFSASIVRAAVVSGLSLLAWYYGRRFRPLLLILLVAALTALWNPLYLWSDIGWYLSFLAFGGILMVAPLLARRIYGQRQPGLVAQVVIESLAAQIMTLPLIMFIFGEFSLLALVANVLVVPLVPIAMLLSLIAGVGGMIAPAYAGWLAWPAKIILTYILDVAALVSRVPNIFAKQSVSVVQMLGLYAVLLLCCMAMYRKLRTKNATITDEITTNKRGFYGWS